MDLQNGYRSAGPLIGVRPAVDAEGIAFNCRRSPVGMQGRNEIHKGSAPARRRIPAKSTSSSGLMQLHHPRMVSLIVSKRLSSKLPCQPQRAPLLVGEPDPTLRLRVISASGMWGAGLRVLIVLPRVKHLRQLGDVNGRGHSRLHGWSGRRCQTTCGRSPRVDTVQDVTHPVHVLHGCWSSTRSGIDETTMGIPHGPNELASSAASSGPGAATWQSTWQSTGERHHGASQRPPGHRPARQNV